MNIKASLLFIFLGINIALQKLYEIDEYSYLLFNYNFAWLCNSI